MRFVLTLLATLVATGCGASQGQAPVTSPPAGSPSATAPGATTSDRPAADNHAQGSGALGPASPNPLVDGRAPDPKLALPRLGIKHVGLHVGGGSGSAEERKALLGALEAQERRLLECYRHVDRPSSGGTFGADLFVAARGGHPEIRSLRHKLGGEGFEGCMTDALAGAAFGPQVRPIVVSYSLRFELSP